MFVIYDEIRLDPSVKAVELCDTDWAINPRSHIMRHYPTETIFDIAVDEKATEGEPLTIMDFSSRLVAIDKGCALPDPETIETLGRAALVLYLVAMGYMRPSAEAEACLPDGMQQGYAC